MFLVAVLASAAALYFYMGKSDLREINVEQMIAAMEDGPVKTELEYGRDLIFKTGILIGPNSEKKISGSLMACANCHIQGGGKPFGLPLFDSHGQYPQFRSREGRVLTLAERINSCLTVPLRGKPLQNESREMQALLLYIRFLGSGRPILTEEKDHRLPPIEYPDFAASPERGGLLYKTRCVRCHGENGEGQMAGDKTSFIYPPLWGPESYSFGSSMSRVSIFARFIKANMPHGEASFANPVLTDSEALDIAAFVNSEQINPRPDIPPGKVLYPVAEFKPFDYSRGPYGDPFPPDQHKYGPFKPIIDFYKEKRVVRKLTDGDLNAP